MGWRFTCKTFCAVALVSWLSEVHAHFVHLDTLNPLYAGAIGGTLMGVGLIVLTNEEQAQHLQSKYGLKQGRAG